MECMEKALAHFQSLLEQQFKRLETMDKPKKDFSKMDTMRETSALFLQHPLQKHR